MEEVYFRYGLAVIVLIVGLAFLFGLFRFGVQLFGKQTFHIFEEINALIHHFGPDHKRYRLWIESLSNLSETYLEKRNDFWEHYGQVALAVLIVIVLAVLLLTKAISAEAGLPILSAVAGFAIAKSNSSSSTNRRGSTDPNEG